MSENSAPAKRVLRPGKTIVITPTRNEYRPVYDGLRGWLAADRLEIKVSGIGMQRAGAICQVLERETALSCLALIGWAGSLSPDLAVGDPILADLALNPGSPPVYCKTLDLDLPSSGSASAIPIRIGPLMTVPHPLYTPQSKQAASQQGALAVEMEAYPLAAWAQAHGIPFVHARVILDAAGEPLPNLGGVLDPTGHLRPWVLARKLWQRPALALDLWRLLRRIREVSPRLKWLGRAVVESLAKAPE